jgi:putative component of membrane protein insertase Oxa1/YidC/SpoIIIJ protein YidD
MTSKYSRYYVCHITDYRVNHLLSAEVNLYRPKMVVLKVVAVFFALICYILVASTASCYLSSITSANDVGLWEQISSFLVFWSIVTVTFSASKFSELMILLYQRYAKASTRLRCRCVPSCSQYSLIAFRKYGFVYGCYKMIYHVKRCAEAPYYEFP